MNAPQSTDVQAAQKKLDKARKDLGPQLRGFSVVDLLADNFPWSLDRCREVARQLT